MSDDLFNDLETFTQNMEQKPKQNSGAKKQEFTYDLDDGALDKIISGKKQEVNVPVKEPTYVQTSNQ